MIKDLLHQPTVLNVASMTKRMINQLSWNVLRKGPLDSNKTMDINPRMTDIAETDIVAKTIHIINVQARMPDMVILVHIIENHPTINLTAALVDSLMISEQRLPEFMTDVHNTTIPSIQLMSIITVML